MSDAGISIPVSDPDLLHLQLPQHFEQLLVVRLIGNVVNIFVGELAFLVDNKERAFGDTVVLPIGTVRFGYFTFGMKVAQKIVGKSADTSGPRRVTRNAVN